MKISVVIPTLNEAALIEHTLDQISQQNPFELIISDGASDDETVQIASRYGVVVSSHRGRARQMNAGAAAASGDVLLFLHADTVLPTDGLSLIRSMLVNEEILAGAFRLRFNTNTLLLRFYAFCTRLPLPSLCFGDRGLFVRRAVFEETGGFPDVPIFEDLEMVKSLYARNQFAFMPAYVTTAARRFHRHGHLKQQLLNAYLWTRYKLGTSVSKLAHFYEY